MTVQTAATSLHTLREAKKTVLASALGGVLEYYDFFIYGSAAALIFSSVFFPEAGALALISSLATFGVAYVARPLGALVLGHFGDKLGRKRVLIWSLVLMGAATFLIGCLPSFESIGIAAPILLVAGRLLQGLSAGGETAGASALILEKAPSGRRGLYTAWVHSGIYGGFVLATLVFLGVTSMPEEQLFSWGWRLPFWFSLVLLIVAFVIRRSLTEPEIFVEEKDRNEVSKLPVAELLKHHWADVLRVAGLAIHQAIFSLVMVFGLAFATATVGIPRQEMLVLLLVMATIGIIFAPLGGHLSDRFGRKPVYMVSSIGCAVLAFPFVWAIATSNLGILWVTGILLMGVFYTVGVATSAAYFSELFSVRVRYSGTAVSMQVGLIISGFSPTIASALVGGQVDNWSGMAWILVACCAIPFVALLASPETAKEHLSNLGLKHQNKEQRSK